MVENEIEENNKEKLKEKKLSKNQHLFSLLCMKPRCQLLRNRMAPISQICIYFIGNLIYCWMNIIYCWVNIMTTMNIFPYISDKTAAQWQSASVGYGVILKWNLYYQQLPHTFKINLFFLLYCRLFMYVYRYTGLIILPLL